MLHMFSPEECSELVDRIMQGEARTVSCAIVHVYLRVAKLCMRSVNSATELTR